MAKNFAFDFPFNQIKPKIIQKMKYPNTDSLIYMVNSDDVKEDLKELDDPLKFSNYHKDFCINSVYNKKTVFFSEKKWHEKNWGICRFEAKVILTQNKY